MGVTEIATRTLHGAYPSSPEKEGSQVFHLFSVGDIVLGRKRSLGVLVNENIGVICPQFSQRICLGGSQGHNVPGLIVAIFLQFRLDVFPDNFQFHVGGFSPVFLHESLDVVLVHVNGDVVQGFGGVVGAALRPVTHEGAVLHECVLVEDLLAFLDGGFVHHDLARRRFEAGHGRCVVVGLVAYHADPCYADDQDEQQWLPPILCVHEIADALGAVGFSLFFFFHR
ncbi:MAG: hypothetical protein IPM82_30910 [Saprospiraceae bacterium]|nr:hypothetical protein [Saprospiraceae bacterium]